MTIAEIMEKMIVYSEGSHHDINHFMKVWGFARTIAEKEAVDEETKFIAEAAAIVHDIACPLCREKYGNTNGRHQEEEGVPLVYDFFRGTDLSKAQVDRIAYLVGHHHTLTHIEGMDYRILIEADYLVNADESEYSKEAVIGFGNFYFKTETGRKFLSSIYDVKLSQ